MLQSPIAAIIKNQRICQLTADKSGISFLYPSHTSRITAATKNRYQTIVVASNATSNSFRATGNTPHNDAVVRDSKKPNTYFRFVEVMENCGRLTTVVFVEDNVACAGSYGDNIEITISI